MPRSLCSVILPQVATLAGMEARRAHHTGPLMCLLLVVLLVAAEVRAEPCHKCYRPVYSGKAQGHLLRTHSYLDTACYDPSRLTICMDNGRSYWLAENKGTYKQRESGDCPEEEKWICFEQRSKEGLQKGLHYQDLIREQTVRSPNDTNLANSGWEALSKGKNLFVDLGERISRELNITNCWVCGRTLMSEVWPWRGSSVGPLELLKWKHTSHRKRVTTESWLLNAPVIGEECLWRLGKDFTEGVGHTQCKRYLVTNGSTIWWIPKTPEIYWSRHKPKGRGCIRNSREKLYQCYAPGKNPYTAIPEISKFWRSIKNKEELFWKAPKELYWICNDRAYPVLPPRWKGSCTLGIIQPGFFLLSEQEGEKLGVPLYDDLKRKKRYLTKSSQRWGDDEWPPERIIETYGPATWVQDRSWGYRTPVYMLNRIIRLQAVVEIISNQTASALELIIQQQRQTRAAIYQNRLALDYLLAEEGGVCGKFNTSDCCLKIDDHGDAVLNLAKNIRKIAHVPVQKWNSIIQPDWWKDWFNSGWGKKIGFLLLCSLTGVIFLPCMIPCLIKLITRTVQKTQEAITTKKTLLLESVEETEGTSQEARLIKEKYEQFCKLRNIYESQME